VTVGLHYGRDAGWEGSGLPMLMHSKVRRSNRHAGDYFVHFYAVSGRLHLFPSAVCVCVIFSNKC